MASAVEDDVTCPVCLEIFREPVALNCLHTLCKECSTLSAIQIDPNTVKCPTCQAITPVNLVKHDFKTQNWVDLYNQLKAKANVFSGDTESAQTQEKDISPESTNVQSTMDVDSPAGSSDGAKAKEAEANLGAHNQYPGAHNQYPGTGSMQQYPGTGSMQQYPGTSSMQQYPGTGSMQQYPGTSSMQQYPGTDAMPPYPPYPAYPPVPQANPPPFNPAVAPTPNLYPKLDLPPTYNEATQPYEPIDETSLRNFSGVNLYPEEIFKFHRKALAIRKIQQRIWVILDGGSVKVFQKTGYQFGKYISNDIEIQQEASALWTMVKWAGGGKKADKYVYKATAVTEAHNGEVIVSCNGVANQWGYYDNVGLVKVNHMGHVLNIISQRHYGDVRSQGQNVYALPMGKGQRKVEIFQHNNNTWTMQRKIIVEPETTYIALAPNTLYASVYSENGRNLALYKYDLSAKPIKNDKHAEYPNTVIENNSSIQPIICCADHHGNGIMADTENGRLNLIYRNGKIEPIRIMNRDPFRPRDVVMEDRRTMLALTETENGIARLNTLQRK